jgi:hypothetical protein
MQVFFCILFSHPRHVGIAIDLSFGRNTPMILFIKWIAALLLAALAWLVGKYTAEYFGLDKK